MFQDESKENPPYQTCPLIITAPNRGGKRLFGNDTGQDGKPLCPVLTPEGKCCKNRSLSSVYLAWPRYKSITQLFFGIKHKGLC